MIVKPKIFKRVKTEQGTKEVLGGYLLNDEKFIKPLMIPKFHFGTPTIIKEENLVYDLVNNINSVSYKVNNDVLDFLAS